MRLNQAIREEIKRGAFKALDDRRKVIELREQALCIRCYEAAIDGVLLKHIRAVAAGDPKQRWLRDGSRFRFNVGGRCYALSTYTQLLPQPSNYYGYADEIGKPIEMSKHRKLIDEVWAWGEDDAQYKEDRKVAETTMDAMLKGVHSTDALFKIWPEGKKFYSTPPLSPSPPKVYVPAVQVEALNKMIGLTT